MVSVSRRQFFRSSLLGATSLVAACTSRSESQEPPILVALFSRAAVFRSGVPQRISFGLIDNGVPISGADDDLPVRVLKAGDVVSELTVSGRLVAHDHTDGGADEDHEHSNIIRYYALRTVFPEPGVYDIEVDFGDSVASLPVQIFAAEDVALPGVGDRFPNLETPTFSEPSGVDLVCSRVPECPLHSVSAADVVGAKPMALLISTPAFCATSYCGPVLDVLLDEVSNYPNVEFIHVEVYANPREVGGNFNDPNIRPAPALEELNLEFEPSLFLVDERAFISDRIDNVFDGAELRAALDVL